MDEETPDRRTFHSATEEFSLIHWSKTIPRNDWKGYLLIAPAVLGMLVVALYPLLNGLSLGFLNYNLLNMGGAAFGKFIGLGNYQAIFQDEIFHKALWNTLVWTVSNLGLQLGIGILTALVLNKKLFFRPFFRLMILIPWVMPSVVAALTWRFLYDTKIGIVNLVLVRTGLIPEAQAWLGNIATALPAVILESVWKGMPFCMIMVLAALQGIPEELYEAARIDGAGKLQVFRSITLPMVRSTIAITSILTTIWTINNFNAVWLMTQGGPLNSTEILFTYAYRKAFMHYDFGLSSAISTIIFGIIAALTTVYVKMAKEEG